MALPLPGGSTVQLPLSLAQYLAWAGDANITEILVTNLVLETTIPDGSTSWGIQLPVPADTQLLSFSDWIAEADYYTESATARPWINYGTQQWTAIPTQVSPGIFAGTIGPPQQGALSKGNAGTIGASSTVPLQVVGQHEIPGDLTLVYTNASGIDITAALSGVFAFIPAAVWKTYFEPLRQGLEQIWRAFGPDLKAAGE